MLLRTQAKPPVGHIRKHLFERVRLRLKVVSREIALLALLVPFRCPSGRAKSLVRAVELLTGRKVLTLRLDAAKVVYVVLEAAVCLVLVRKPWIRVERVELCAKIGVGHEGKDRSQH